MHAIQAQFDGLCDPCGNDITKGEWIIGHREHGWIHEDCSDLADTVPQIATESRTRRDHTPATMPRGKTAKDRCERCFQVPASNGACGC